MAARSRGLMGEPICRRNPEWMGHLAYRYWPTQLGMLCTWPLLLFINATDRRIDDEHGFEFAAHVRAREEWRLIPIVVMTAYDLSSEDRLRLNGYVETVLPTDGDPSDTILNQVRDLLVNCTAPLSKLKWNRKAS